MAATEECPTPSPEFPAGDIEPAPLHQRYADDRRCFERTAPGNREVEGCPASRDREASNRARASVDARFDPRRLLRADNAARPNGHSERARAALAHGQALGQITGEG